MKKNSSDIVILANGLFPGSRHCLDALDRALQIICCDGAVDKLLRYGLRPDVIVGDMDSISENSRSRFASILRPSSGQDSNDLTKAVNYCIDQGYTSSIILGATGLREDHTLGNISLMLEYHPRIRVCILSDYGEFSLIESGEEMASVPGEQLSFFSVDNRIRVNAKGLKYPLDKLQLSHWYTATLNESTGFSFSLEFTSDHPLILYRVRSRT